MPEPLSARCSRAVLLSLTPALAAHSGMQTLNCAQVPSLICVCQCVCANMQNLILCLQIQKILGRKQAKIWNSFISKRLKMHEYI